MDSAPNKQRLHFSLDYRVIIIILLAVIIGMFTLWRPWETPNATGRTVSVTGEATVKAEPDEYDFNPTYQFKNTGKSAAIAEATAKQNEIVAKLKTLGVADKQIKTTIDGYGDYVYYDSTQAAKPQTYTYTLNVEITLPNRTAAQKVQDYVATTDPISAVTPYANFSDSLRKKLESQARDAATKDARSKADQSAKNLGFKVGKIKSIQDGSGFDGGIYNGLNSGADLSVTKAGAAASPSVQPGQNDLDYSVDVVYFIR